MLLARRLSYNSVTSYSCAPPAAAGLQVPTAEPGLHRLQSASAQRLRRRQWGLQLVLAASSSGQQDGSPGVGAASKRGPEIEMVKHRTASRYVMVPEGLAAQLGPLARLCDIADRAALARAVAALGPKREQGVVEHGVAVVAYLKGLGLERQQVGPLLLRCPLLFSLPVEQRAGVLLGQLVERLGLSANEAARCFKKQPESAGSVSFMPAIGTLGPLFASGSRSRGSSKTGEQLLGDFLRKQPSALKILKYQASLLAERIAYLQQLAFSDAQIVSALQDHCSLLPYSTERMAALEAVLQQELGADRALWAKALARAFRLAGCAVDTLRARAQALVKEFGRKEAQRMVDVGPHLLMVNTAVWRCTLAVMRLRGVGDPAAGACSNPQVLCWNWLQSGRQANLLVMQRAMQLSAAAVLQPPFISYALISPQRLAGRLIYLQQQGLLPLLVTDKRLARRQWRADQGLPVSQKAVGEPLFISLGDVYQQTDAKFCSLLEGQQRPESAAGYAAFMAGLAANPAYRQLWQDAEAEVAWLRQRLPAELLRQLDREKEGEEEDPAGGL